MLFKLLSSCFGRRVTESSDAVDAPRLPLNDKEQHRCRFLDLPGEIRNKIYEEVFASTEIFVIYSPFNVWISDPSHDHLHASSPSEPGEYRQLPFFDYSSNGPLAQWLRNTIGSSLGRPLSSDDMIWKAVVTHQGIRQVASMRSQMGIILRQGRKNSRFPKATNWHVNIGLLWTCRQIYSETVLQFYPKLSFAFGSPIALRDWLDKFDHNVNDHYSNSLPKTLLGATSKLQFITSLHLECRAVDCCWQGSRDRRSRNRLAQEQYYNSWSMLCSRIVQTMTSLKDLSLYICVPSEIDIHVRLNDIWIPPFLLFAACRSLNRVDVKLDSKGTYLYEELLVAFAEVIRGLILGWNSQKICDTIDRVRDLAIQDAETDEVRYFNTVAELMNNFDDLEFYNKKEIENRTKVTPTRSIRPVGGSTTNEN